MNPYQFEVVCDLCGESGVGTQRTAAAAWMANSRIYHTDPQVCDENLKAKARRAKLTVSPEPEFTI
jgi:hypothetical protein